MPVKAMEEATQMDRANVKKYQAMLPETLTLLQDFYRPYNKRLADLLGGDERWLWGY